MIRRGFLVVVLLQLYCIGIDAQSSVRDTIQKKDLIDVLLRLFHMNITDSSRKKNSVIFSIIPVAPVSTGQRQAVVSSINAAFYAGKPATTNLSSIYFVPYSNFSDRSGFVVTPNVWLSRNRWNLNGDVRITNNSTYTYGIGGNTLKNAEDEVDYRYIRVYLNANHKVAGPFNVGVGFNYDYDYNVRDTRTNGYPDVFSIYGVGTGPETTSTGLTFNLLLDERKNSINPAGGIYSSLIYRVNPSFFPNDYKWQSIYFDSRKYFSFSEWRHSILGIWAVYWGCYGNVPYFNTPGTALDGGGRIGRGYPMGRYRGKQMLYGETEYRFDLSKNGLFGGVVFCNVQSYTQPVSGEFSYLLPAGGCGLRIKFNKRSDTNLALDIAAGKNSFAWYLNLGEFF